MKQQEQFVIQIRVLFICTICQLCGALRNNEHDLSMIQLNFTSCGKTGRNGPSYNDCVEYYKSQNSATWKFLINQTDILMGAQFFQVSITGTYEILLVGASGGKGVCSPYVGGGAILHSQRFLNSDQLYSVTIGQSGESACDGDRFTDLCAMSVENCTRKYNDSNHQIDFKESPPYCLYDGGGGGGGGTVFNEVSQQSDGSGLAFLEVYSAAGGGGSGAIFNGTDQLKDYANADGVNNSIHRPLETSNGERPEADTCPYSGFGGGTVRSALGDTVDGYPNTLPSISGTDRSYKLGGFGCAINGTNGGFGGGGGACVSGGGGGGFGGGSVLSYSPYEPGQGGTSRLNDMVNSTGNYNYYGSGYITITLLDCGCTGECVKNLSRNVFHCVCGKETTTAPDNLDCYKGIYYDVTNFSPMNTFTARSSFGFVDFTIYRVPEVFGIYGVEATFNTSSEKAQCALATALYSVYTGVTEIVTLTAGGQNVTDLLSQVKTNIIFTPSINFVDRVEVLPPAHFHNKSVVVSELVVLSFIPHTKCTLTSVFFNQSQRHLTKTDSFNDTTLTVLADKFLDSYYTTQSQESTTGTPANNNDGGGDNKNEHSVSIIAGSIAFVLGLILVLLIMLWFGSKFFSNNKTSLKLQNDSTSSTVPLIASFSKLDDSISPGYDRIDDPTSKFKHYEVLESSFKFGITSPPVDFYAYNCQRKDCSLNSEERWGYPREYLVYLREIGEGQFGKVHLMNAKDICGFKGILPVAVKVLTSRAEAEVRVFTEEAELLKRFSHPNIVSLLGFCCATEDASPMMILEFMQFGDLQSFLVHNKPSSKSTGLSLSTFYSIAADVATALDFLSSNRYVHRDVAARNCLVGEGLCVKLGDFGLARRMEDKDYYLMGGKRVLPVRWMAPESLVYGLSTSASDVWSYGVLLWEIITYGEMPHRSRNVQELIQLAEEYKLCLEKPPGCPDSFYETIRLCHQANIKNRPSFAALLVWAKQHTTSSHNDN